MAVNGFDIRFVDSWPTEEIVRLYQAGGWWSETADASNIPALICGSFAFAVVVEKTTGAAVGMGRVLSDGVSDAYIQDMVLLPPYRNRGLGKQLAHTLVEHCLSRDIRWIGLIAEPGYDGFYKSVGFNRMKEYVPMLYALEE